MAKNCEEKDASIVARQMAHDPRVSAQYYQAIKNKFKTNVER